MTHDMNSFDICKKMLLIIGLCGLLISCDSQEANPEKGADSESQTATVSTAASDTHAMHQLDLPGIKETGILRVLMPRWGSLEQFPKQGIPSFEYQAVSEEFANSLGLTVQWVAKRQFDELIPALLAGEGDIIATNLTVTPSREQQLLFSLPVDQIQELLVVADERYQKLEDLTGKTIALPNQSSYFDTLQGIIDQQALTINVRSLDSAIAPDEVIDRLVKGEFQGTLLDSNTARALLQYRDDFLLQEAVSEVKNIAFALRPSNPELAQSLNAFLTEKAVQANQETVYFDDFEGIKKRKLLRVITQNNPATYFVWRGQLMGFEYELAQLFARKHKLQLSMVVPPEGTSMLEYLKQGYGDVIAASMTKTNERISEGFAFSRDYNTVSEVIVAKRSFDDLSQLKGIDITVNPERSYWSHLKPLAAELGFNLVASKTSLSTDELITQVAQGEIMATVSDSHIAQIEQTFFPDLHLSLKLKEDTQHGWVVRDSNQQLLSKINEFFDKSYRGLEYNLIYQKYFVNDKKIKHLQGSRLGKVDTISPFDDIVKEYAKQYQFDWRMMVAQMYQESGFNPKAKSYANARGLFQVVPRTAKQMGFSTKQLSNPKQGIKAGIQYMSWVREQFEPTLSVDQRLWFTLASYNAGYGHVFDARRLAQEQGLDPDQWFGHVEKAMLLLSKRKYFKKARYGYVRGIEPVTYVNNIRALYQAYIAKVDL